MRLFFYGQIKRQHNTAPVWLEPADIPQGKKGVVTWAQRRLPPPPVWCLHASASNFKNNNNCKNISFSLPVMWPDSSSTWSDEELADVLSCLGFSQNASGGMFLHISALLHISPPELAQNLHRSPWAVSVTAPWGIWMLIPWHHFHFFSQVLETIWMIFACPHLSQKTAQLAKMLPCHKKSAEPVPLIFYFLFSIGRIIGI